MIVSREEVHMFAQKILGIKQRVMLWEINEEDAQKEYDECLDEIVLFINNRAEETNI